MRNESPVDSRQGSVMISVPSLSSVGVQSGAELSAASPLLWSYTHKVTFCESASRWQEAADSDRCSLSAPSSHRHAVIMVYSFILSPHKTLKGRGGPPRGGYESSILAHTLILALLYCDIHSMREITPDATGERVTVDALSDSLRNDARPIMRVFLKGPELQEDKYSSDELLRFLTAWDNVFSTEPALPVEVITIAIYQ